MGLLDNCFFWQWVSERHNSSMTWTLMEGMLPVVTHNLDVMASWTGCSILVVQIETSGEAAAET